MKNTSHQTYLVTGAAGFIGSRFTASCAKRGIRTISVDKREHFDSRSEHRGIDFGTIIDRDELSSWLEREAPALSAIIHLGACTDTTELDEAYLKKVNLDYSQMLWRHCSKHGVPFVYASSAATYGDGALGYDDDESLIPSLRALNPYGESKRLFDLWALEQEKAGLQPPAWSGFKFFNVYGFGERHKGKMSSVVIQALDQIRATGKMRLFRSHNPAFRDGEQLRDFVFVDDVVNVLHFAAERPLRRGIYNLGSGKARSFLDLVRAVFRELNQPEAIEFFDMPPVIRDRYQYFTEARMERLQNQGYRNEFTSIEEGVHRYIQELLAAEKAR